MADKDTIRSEVKDLIQEVLPELGDVDLEKKVVSDYSVDSVSLIRLIVSAESHFGIEFTDYELDLDTYDTFGDLAERVFTKVQQNEEE